MHTTTHPGAVMTRDGTSAKDAEFSAWMTARQPALLRTAYLLTGDHHSAEDLVQTTLAKVYLSWDKVRKREVVDAYARRILVNENNSIWRRAWKKREVTQDEVPEQRGVRDRYDEGQSSALWEHVQTLPRKQRAVIVLPFYEHLTDSEIAQTLGITSGTVRSQMFHALAKLRRVDDPAMILGAT